MNYCYIFIFRDLFTNVTYTCGVLTAAMFSCSVTLLCFIDPLTDIHLHT